MHTLLSLVHDVSCFPHVCVCFHNYVYVYIYIYIYVHVYMCVCVGACNYVQMFLFPFIPRLIGLFSMVSSCNRFGVCYFYVFCKFCIEPQCSLSVFVMFCLVLGIEPGASHTLGKHPVTCATPSPVQWLYFQLTWM
jgi:hypothetical protein